MTDEGWSGEIKQLKMSLHNSVMNVKAAHAEFKSFVDEHCDDVSQLSGGDAPQG